MKRITLLFLVSLVATLSWNPASAQEALITGYVDSPCPGADGRTVELYVSGTIDFTGWNLARQSNGGGFSSNIDISSLGTVTDAFVYVTNDEATLENEFDITASDANVIENGSISDNGDDAFQLTNADDDIIDRFGEDGVDGTDTDWEHTDSYYYRNDNSSTNAGDFDVSNWTIGELNALDDQGTCNDADPLSAIVPFGSYQDDNGDNDDSDCELLTESFSEGFETEIPECWTVINNDGQGETWQYEDGSNTNTSPINGEGSAQLKYESEAHDDYLISPRFSVINGVTDQVSFKAGGTGTYYPETFDVKVSTSGNSVEDFTETIASETTTDDTDEGEFTIYNYSLTDYIDQDIYIAIVGTSTNEFYLVIDDFTVQTPPSCPLPSEVDIAEIGADTAHVSWTGTEEATSYEVVYDTTGFDPLMPAESTMSMTVDETSTTLTGLNPNTEYDVYVHSICSEDDMSEFSQAETFTTLSLAPENDNLCDAIALTVDETCSGDTYTNFGATTQPDEPNASCINTAEKTVWFTFEAPESGNVTVTTDIEPGDLSDSELVIFGAPTDCDDLTTLGDIIACDQDGGDLVGSGYMAVASVQGLAAGETYYVQVGGYSGFGDAAEGDFCIEVRDDGFCIAPMNVQIADIATDTANVSWDASTNATGYEVVYDTTGFDPSMNNESTTVLNVTGTDTTLTDLEDDTQYDVYVRSLCSENDSSEFSEVGTFTTLAAPPENDNLCNAIALTVDETCSGDAYTNIGATTQLDEPGAPCVTSPQQTVWFSFEAPESGNVTVTTDIAPGDLNNSELVIYNSPSDCGDLTTLGDPIGCDQNSGEEVNLMSIVTLQGLTPGETYYAQVDGYNGFGGTAEGDFCIEVLDDGDCFAPDNINITDISPNTANVNWDEANNAVSYEVVYDTTGFDPMMNNDSSTTLTVFGTDTTITDLDTDTEYDVYIRTNCSMGESSDFSEVESFTTLPPCPEPTDLMVDNVSQNTADISWTAGNDETEWEVIYGEAGFDPDNGGIGESPINVTSDPNTQLTGLDTSTGYDFYVRAICGDDDQSEWTGPESFITNLENGYCTPGNGSNYYLGTFSTIGGFDNIDNTIDEAPTDGYEDFTDQSVSQAPGGTIEFTSSQAGTTYGLGLKIWVDWDQDGTFNSDDELVFQTSSYQDNPSGSIDVPSDVMMGTTRMRVGSSYIPNDGPEGPCSQGNNNYLSFQDYSFEVTVAPCEMPSDITFSETASDSTNVMWTENGDASEWMVLYGETGFDPETDGTMLTVTESPETTLNDLMPDTEYEVYIRAICGDDDQSEWAGPVTFTTSIVESCEMPSDITFSETASDSTNVMWTENGDSSEWMVLYGETGFDPETDGTMLTVTESPEITLNDLMPDTDYDVYIRAICGDENESEWAGPVTFTTSTASVNSQDFKDFSFYPNPVRSTINLNAKSQIDHIVIHNMIGQKVMDRKSNRSNMQLNVQDFAAGVYFMRVTIDGNHKTFKLVKE